MKKFSHPDTIRINDLAMEGDLARWKSWTKELNWKKIAWWSHQDLCRLGIDTINLLCALGLPGAEEMNVDLCLKTIEEWAEKVRLHTAQMMHVFEENPARFDHSRGYFRALTLITVLQRDCGVRYNAAKIDLSVPLQVADSFLFGIIQGAGGTCASLPVLYCAVGYRLGYPMFLMRAKGEKATHLYVQWDDGEVRFNIEATAQGMYTPSDDHYRTGRYQISLETERKGCFLSRHNMRQCFASFLAERAEYWIEVQSYRHAIEAMGWAAALHPENVCYLNTAKMYYNQWLTHWRERQPPHFPSIFITRIEQRRFAATVPVELELALCGLEVTECLLKDSEHNAKYWDPLRQGKIPANLPVEVEAEVTRSGGKNVRFLFEKKLDRQIGDFQNV